MWSADHEIRGARAALRDDDYRDPAERDYDRILYSDEFRRLGHVTQVVATAEKRLYHNRLTHSLKVAQLGKRLAQFLRDRADADALEAAGTIDPTVVELAGLAHDIGHPPFGHLAEKTLQKCLEEDESVELPDSFEGNAQSFRIVTKLSFRSPDDDEPALNLTRASLRALLKYPWLYGRAPEGAPADKWGAYESEQKLLEFTDALGPAAKQSPEAALMDFADDLAFAVHDVEDFFRAGLIPLHLVSTDAGERMRFIGYSSARLAEQEGRGYNSETATQAFANIVKWLPNSPYLGRRQDAEGLHAFVSTLITRYFAGVSLLTDGSVHIDDDKRHEVAMLKQLTWFYVIDRPGLATLQRGHARVVRELYAALGTWVSEAADKAQEQARLPLGLQEMLRAIRTDPDALGAYGADDIKLQARSVVDYIASLTEAQALALHSRLYGLSDASALDDWLRS